MSNTIHKDEIDDVNTELKNRGLSISDFTLSRRDEQIPADGIHPIRSKISVLRKSTGKVSSYQAGHATSWIVEFTKDIDDGKFN